MPNQDDDWERVLSAAAHLQTIIPDAVLVGGTASTIHANHRFSNDDDHVVTNLKNRFEKVLEDLTQYRVIANKWKSWDSIKAACRRYAVEIFKRYQPAALKNIPGIDS